MKPRVSWALRPVLFVLACSAFAIAQHPSVLPADQKADPGIQTVKAWEPAPVTPLPEHWQPAVEMAPVSADPVAGGGKLPDHVLHDARDGVLWALGPDYKASFDQGGMTFVPYFGAAAPRNFPVRFTVTSIHRGEQALPIESRHAPRRERDCIRIARGACVETYDLGLHAVEQSFVFPPQPTTGDLCVRLRAETELTMVATAGGLAFRGEHGSVTYEKAVVFDGAGQRATLAIERAGDDQIVLRVPQQFLTAATGPITIDPLVATFFPATGSPVDFHPDVSFVGGSIVTVWQRVWSSIDHDVFVEWRANLAVQAIDFTAENWEWPRIATDATSGAALVVAEVGQPWLQRVIKGRIVNPTTFVAGPFQVSGAEPGEAINCDVGGDPSGLPGTRFCVVWERQFSSTDRDILFRTVNPNGTFGTPFSAVVDASGATIDTRPRIGGTCGPVAAGSPQFWPVVWQRRFNPTDEDIRAAAIGSTGAVILSSFSADAAAANDTNPVVSSPTVPFGASSFGGGRAFLIAYERAMSSGGHDVIARVFSGATSLAGPQNLAVLANPSAAAVLDQIRPSADCDGLRFVLAWGQRDPFNVNGDNNLFVSTWTLAGGLSLHEPPRLLNSNFFGLAELNPSIANAPGTTLHPVVFERVTTAPTDRDVFGALFDSNLARAPFRTGGCPNPPISTTAFPIAPLFPGSPVTVTFSPTLNVTAPIIALGPLTPPIPVCVPCTLHVDLSSASITTGTMLSFTIPADPRLVGTTIVAQAFGDFWLGWLSPGTGCVEYFLTYSRAVVMPIN